MYFAEGGGAPLTIIAHGVSTVMVFVKPLLALLLCLFIVIGLYLKRDIVQRRLRRVVDARLHNS